MNNAQKILIMMIAGLVLAGCKTTSDLYGTGPINLSPSVQGGFEKYQRAPAPGFFAVSPNGRSYGYSYCSSGSCQPTLAQIAIDSCNKKSKEPCKIYAREKFVVWGGQIKSGMAVKSADVVCAYAVDYSTGKPEWSKVKGSSNYIREAKRRGFTIEKCDQLN